MEINIVTGASGFVGKYLIKRLLESGKNVWAVIRPLRGISAEDRALKIFGAYLDTFPKTFRAVTGDITLQNLGIDPADLNDASNKDIVFWHLAADLSFLTKQKDNVFLTNHTGTVNTIHVANNIARKYIYVSTAYVCGDTKKMFHEQDLDTGQTFRNYYESSKFAAEKYIRSNCRIPYAVFRPSIIMGDAYEGKAEGCTFGYYRFAYMFFVFRNWLTDKIVNGTFVAKKLLACLGTKYDKKNNTLTVPWLCLPYTPHGTVDMIPINYVIDGLVAGANATAHGGQTIHLTNPNPPSFKFALSSLIDDLGYKKVKYVKVPPAIFITGTKILYYIFFPLRVKLRSAMWYLPYITRRYYFSQENNRIIGLPEHIPITRDFLKEINTYAQKEIFSHIDKQ